MRETLKKVVFDRLPGTREEFRALLEEKIATPEGAAAMLVMALAVAAKDREAGFGCLCDACAEPPDRVTFDALVPEGPELEEIASSYVHVDPEAGTFSVTVKLTDEKALKRRMKTVYVGCSATGSYRPLTLASKPPRHVAKRFGFKNGYYEDPWLAAEYPSMVLPVTAKN
jgi:hypothetical protein